MPDNDDNIQAPEAQQKPRKQKFHLIRPAWLRIPLKVILWLALIVVLIPVLIYFPPVQDLLTDVACDVLKAPYHGRWVGASRDFLTAASPRIAFITESDEERSSGQTAALLEQLGCAVYSARDGDLTVISDGDNVEVTDR